MSNDSSSDNDITEYDTRILAPFSQGPTPPSCPPCPDNKASAFPSRGRKRRRLDEIIDERFSSMSAKIEGRLADRDRRHFEMAANMAAKVLKLEDEVDRQAKQIQALKEEMEVNERERKRQSLEIVHLREASDNVRNRLIDHSRKIQMLASDAANFLNLFDNHDAT